MELPVILTTRTGKLVVIASVAAAAAAVVLTAVLLGVLLTLPSDNGSYLPQSGKHEMLVAQKEGAYRKNGQPVILARSYGGNPWEAVPDLDRQPVDIQCNDDNQCTMQTDVDYNVVSVVVPEELRNMTALHLAARLHQQATFGANLATLARVTEVYGTNYGNWIRDQMRLTPTLLRSYYRERANARPGMFDVGQKTAPCDMGSRWHRYVFESRDRGKEISVSHNADSSRFAISIDGQARGEVTRFLNEDYPGTVSLPQTLYLCGTINEEVNGTITFSRTSGGTCNVTWINPTIENISGGAVQVLKETDVLLVPVVGARAGSFVLKMRLVSCTNASDGAGNSFIRVGTSLYRFDQRLRLLANTLEEPAVVGAADSNGQCPVVAKTNQNRDMCVRRSSCGAGLSFKSALFTLDNEILRSWYTLSRRYVYAVDNLRLEDPFKVSPCQSGASRWRRLGNVTCSAPTAMDATTRNIIAEALRTSTDTNPYVRDILLSGSSDCSPDNTTGAQIQVGRECFQHVHPELFSVRDFTQWVSIHDGNEQAMRNGSANPIAKWAVSGSTVLRFPASHPMMRFFDRRALIPLVGRFGDQVDFESLPVELQTEEIAALVGALRASGNVTGFEACGSPGESASRAELGYHYSVTNWNVTSAYQEALEWPIPSLVDHQYVLENVALKAVDQLRQRTAWSLSNILTIAAQDIGFGEYTEGWTSYYDIFVRHAFGNYLNILRDVSYHPLMGSYLSYRDNRAYHVSNTFPDENYAREIMQLFSIGLWRLNDDGTHKLDARGRPMETYTNADIVDYARLWTGFDRQPKRTNFATRFSFSGNDINVIDSMQVRAQYRDRLPKPKLDDGYLGDAYPLCDDMPTQAFLREGARYEFTGAGSIEGDILDQENSTNVGIRGRFAPQPGTSQLWRALCAPSAVTNACTFPLRVTLNSTLPCTGEQECNAQRLLSVKIYDPVAKLTRYYAYVGLPCVRLTLFSDGRLLKRSNSRRQCADPAARVGYPVCCRTSATRASSNYTSECLFANDVTDYATNEKRCAALDSTMCSSGLSDAPTWRITCANNVNMWTNASCSLQIQVYPSGQVSLVDPAVLAGSGGVLKMLLNSTNNVFRVRWQGNSFPAATAAGTCPSGCQVQPTVDGDSCVCNFTVGSEPAFADFGAISDPSNAVNIIARRAHIGSVKPSVHDAGTYSRCIRSQCTRLANVIVWLHSGDNGRLSERTIFELPPFRRGGRVRYLMNRVSTVSVSASAAYAFRNPPRFAPLSGELYDVTAQEWTSDALWNRKAEHEVEALLEHLFEHDNTAVFVSYRLIQQMITSNPSPRYMKEVVRAFRTGAYRGVEFSGRYGDLAATIYAILMDHEARSPIVEADPTFGMYRDPLVKLLHLMRSLDYQSPKQREVAFADLDDRLGVQPFSAPSVFGFYLPEFRPAGPADEHGLVGPQLQLATTPNLIGFLNGLTSLIDHGLTSCENGLGVFQTYGPSRRCVTTGPHPTADGSLTYTMPINGTVNDLVDELSLVLTAGRLHRSTRETLVREYLSVLGPNVTVNTTAAALRHALKVLVTSAEFQTTSFNSISNKPRLEPAPIAASGRAFKAIVVVFEMGGADSFNKLVPHSSCTGKDLYAEYATVRAGAALDKTLLRPVSVPAGQQPCTVFGVHPAMSNLSKLYSDGDALFVANIGALVEPTTKEQYRKRTVTLPPSLFAHNIMQRSVQNVHAQQSSAEGVLGRIMEAMVESDPPYASELFSLGGNVKMVQGAVPADFISGRSGVVRFRGLNRLRSAVNNMTRFTSSSVFAESYADELMNSIRSTETLGALLGNTSLTATFGKSGLDQQMVQVAKLIKTLPGQGVERAAFFTQTGGFDTHDTFNLSPMFGDVDNALGSFMSEMKEQGRWGDVVVISVSDFARTLTSNGRGTDHGWGGIHWVAGGSVNGKQVLGRYPTTLTDESELSLGQGRLIPTTPFESVWNGIAEWFGVPGSRIRSEVLPNVDNFPASQIFTRAQMFRKAP